MIKSTYTLDLDTADKLERIAKRWNVSKSAALRRIIQAAAATSDPNQEALAALDELQHRLQLTPDAIEQWVSESSRERRASSRKGEST